MGRAPAWQLLTVALAAGVIASGMTAWLVWLATPAPTAVTVLAGGDGVIQRV